MEQRVVRTKCGSEHRACRRARLLTEEIYTWRWGLSFGKQCACRKCWTHIDLTGWRRLRAPIAGNRSTGLCSPLRRRAMWYHPRQYMFYFHWYARPKQFLTHQKPLGRAVVVLPIPLQVVVISRKCYRLHFCQHTRPNKLPVWRLRIDTTDGTPPTITTTGTRRLNQRATEIEASSLVFRGWIRIIAPCYVGVKSVASRAAFVESLIEARTAECDATTVFQSFQKEQREYYPDEQQELGETFTDILHALSQTTLFES